MNKTVVRDDSSVFVPVIEPPTLQWNGTREPIDRIDEFTFVIQSSELAKAHAETGQVVYTGRINGAAGRAVEVQFRVRSADGHSILCSYYDMAISTREAIKDLIADQSRPHARNALQTLTYDELATGDTAQGQVARPSTSLNLKKSAAAGMLAVSMLAILGWVIWVVRSQSDVTVANAVMMGNYIPVNTPLEGKVATLRVAVGDRVMPGQVVATIANPGVDHDLGLAKAKLERAKRDLDGHRAHATEVQKMLKVAEKSLDTRRQVAEAAKARINAELKIANAKVARQEQLVSSMNIRLTEYENAVALRDRLAAELQGQDAVLSGLANAKEAIKQNVIVYDDRVTNPLTEVQVKISAAEAVVHELEGAVALFENRVKAAELIAPAAGTVFAIYRQSGEVLKVAEEVMAINQDGLGWASGHVAADRAASIRPGLPVEIEIPSFGGTARGVVEAIGFRAVHGRGGYSADFRGKPLDVPIRVALVDVSHPLPSGLRINMTVRVRDYVKEFRDWVTRIARRGDGQAAS